jgi:hypothetical protein
VQPLLGATEFENVFLGLLCDIFKLIDNEARIKCAVFLSSFKSKLPWELEEVPSLRDGHQLPPPIHGPTIEALLAFDIEVAERDFSMCKAVGADSFLTAFALDRRFAREKWKLDDYLKKWKFLLKPMNGELAYTTKQKGAVSEKDKNGKDCGVIASVITIEIPLYLTSSLKVDDEMTSVADSIPGDMMGARASSKVNPTTTFAQKLKCSTMQGVEDTCSRDTASNQKLPKWRKALSLNNISDLLLGQPQQFPVTSPTATAAAAAMQFAPGVAVDRRSQEPKSWRRSLFFPFVFMKKAASFLNKGVVEKSPFTSSAHKSARIKPIGTDDCSSRNTSGCNRDSSGGGDAAPPIEILLNGGSDQYVTPAMMAGAPEMSMRRSIGTTATTSSNASRPSAAARTSSSGYSSPKKMVVSLGGINDDNNDYCLDYNGSRLSSDGGSSATGEQQQGGRCMKRKGNEQEINDSSSVENREAAGSSTSFVGKGTQPPGTAAGTTPTSTTILREGQVEEVTIEQKTKTKKLAEDDEPAGRSNPDSKSVSVIHSSAHSRKNSPTAKTASSRRRTSGTWNPSALLDSLSKPSELTAVVVGGDDKNILTAEMSSGAPAVGTGASAGKQQEL